MSSLDDVVKKAERIHQALRNILRANWAKFVQDRETQLRNDPWRTKSKHRFKK